jgi:hypothetical protein
MTSLLLLTSAALVAQSNDSQTLQAILQEVRQLRNDLAGTTIAAQRVQILLYRLQLQGDAVKSAAQRHDQTVAKVNDAQRARLDAANVLRTVEEKLASLGGNDSQRPVIEAQVSEMKRRVEMWSHDESDRRVAEIAADSDLKREQATMADLQQRLDELERQLQSYAAPHAGQ